MSAEPMIKTNVSVPYHPFTQWLYDTIWLLGDNKLNNLSQIAFEIDIAVKEHVIPEENRWVTAILEDDMLEIEIDT